MLITSIFCFPMIFFKVSITGLVNSLMGGKGLINCLAPAGSSLKRGLPMYYF